MRESPTEIARVVEVRGARVRAELLGSVAGTVRLYRGEIYRIGQVGSLVTMPVGSIDLVGSVSMLGISEGAIERRWLEIDLLGEVDALGAFRRGITNYPGIDGEVHLATEVVYERVFPAPSPMHIPIGHIGSAASGSPVTVDLGRLVLRHCAIVGSTGSGKTSTVASVIQAIVRAGLRDANIVVIDPHGEYLSAFGSDAQVLSVSAEGGLRVPYWALGLEDLLRVFAAPGAPDAIGRNAFSETVREQRAAFLEGLPSPWFPPQAVTADTPTPFDMRDVWFELDGRNRATYRDLPPEPPQDPLVVEPGDAHELRPTIYERYAPSNRSPHKGREYSQLQSLPSRLLARLADPRFGFLSRTHPTGTDDELPGLLAGWLGDERPISIMDFAGVPSDVADVAIGLVLSLLLEAAIHSPDDGGIGRARPVLVVLEEAHRFIGPATTSPLARQAVDRISREGRKHGLGMMLVSQRPGELSPTALAQCGTIVALRLTNPADQATVRAALPDTLAGLADLLPSLRTGEALVSGEAIVLPARVVINRPSPEPRASDPSLSSWVGPGTRNDLATSIERWRGRLAGDTQ
jgi:hypothetical protein